MFTVYIKSLYLCVFQIDGVYKNQRYTHVVISLVVSTWLTHIDWLLTSLFEMENRIIGSILHTISLKLPFSFPICYFPQKMYKKLAHIIIIKINAS